MRQYLTKRVLACLLTIFLMMIFNFTLMRLAPGDPITAMLGEEHLHALTPEARAEMMARYGLDQSIPRQFVTFISNLLRGDFGTSITMRRPVSGLIAERVIPTVVLGLIGMIFAGLIGTILGVYCARKEGGIVDSIASVIMYTFNAFPGFWLALMLILIIGANVGWIPIMGMTTGRVVLTGWAYVRDVARHMILPVLTMAIVSSPPYFRIAKSSVLQVMNEDFVNTFRATGMSESVIFRKYVFKNAILPTVTIAGMSLAFLITGLMLVEIVFAWPGMGRLLQGGIMQRDYPVMMGILIVLSVSVTVFMLLLDLVSAILDPRIRITK